eukprot:6514753-Prymnesium_polylepis.1
MHGRAYRVLGPITQAPHSTSTTYFSTWVTRGHGAHTAHEHDAHAHTHTPRRRPHSIRMDVLSDKKRGTRTHAAHGKGTSAAGTEDKRHSTTDGERSEPRTRSTRTHHKQSPTPGKAAAETHSGSGV